AGPARIGRDHSVQDRYVRRVDPALERLKPVALLPGARHVAMAVRNAGEVEVGRRRHRLLRAQVPPDDATGLERWVGGRMNLLGEALGLVHLIDAVALDVELPAVVDAAQPALLVAPQPERDA